MTISGVKLVQEKNNTNPYKKVASYLECMGIEAQLIRAKYNLSDHFFCGMFMRNVYTKWY